jgi:hypothetical protein
MKFFHCDHCGQLLYFENVRCLNCDHTLAYLPDLEVVGSLDPADNGKWRSPLERAKGQTYRLCGNYEKHEVCNWAVPVADPIPLCLSCRLTRVIPDLAQPGYKEAWYKLEVAKRRLVYTLLKLGLPLKSKVEDPELGLAFEFLADRPGTDTAPVLTGHANGVITVNMAEADDAEREKRRVNLHEPYRTLLGHFRHEIGHYYWDRVVKAGPGLETFRTLFGDERANYAEALQRHYKEGPSTNWQQHFITAYASVHPWEDWAETWAHYLHMTDTLEAAAACGLSLRPRRRDEPALTKVPDPLAEGVTSFDLLIQSWYPLTHVLNNLNRGMGMPDAYPFVLSGPVIEKLRFIHGLTAA